MLPKSASLFGGLAAVAAVGAYIFWGPSQNKKSRRKDLCPGIENLGNTCFLNAVLQALAPCREVGSWLSNLLSPKSNRHEPFLASAVHRMLKGLNNEGEASEGSLSPGEVLQALRQKRWVISTDEQDAHELFYVLTQTLDEEASKYPSVVSLFDLQTLQDPSLKFQSQKEACTRSQSPLPVLPSRHSDLPFRGLLASQLQCTQCGHKYPVRYDLCDSLSLSIPTNSWGSLTLDKLLQHFIGSETVSQVECEGCGESGGVVRQAVKRDLPKSTFRKKLTIGKLPKCLCLHIQRMVWLDNGMPVKRYERILFPEYFQMDNYIYCKNSQGPTGNRLCGGRDLFGVARSRSNLMGDVGSAAAVNLLRTLNFQSSTTQNGFFLQPPNPSLYPNIHADVNQNSPATPTVMSADHNYRLMAVVVHYGDIFSGHFVTYRRSPCLQPGEKFSKKWIYTSDTQVKRASLEEVLASEAYMLFYEKV